MNFTNETMENDSINFDRCALNPYTKNIPTGVLYITFGVIIVPIYTACAYIIATSKTLQHSCYKIMLAMAAIDIACMLTGAIGAGVISITGAVDCRDPNIWSRIHGSLSATYWFGYCPLSVLLAFNRATSVVSTEWTAILFGGRRCLIWLGACGLYIIVLFVLFLTPYAANCYDSCYGFHFVTEPLAMKLQTYNNWITSLLIVACYVFITCRIRQMRSDQSAQFKRMHSSDRLALIQVTVVCLLTISTSFMYITLSRGYITPSPQLYMGANFAWLCEHGLTCVVYVTLNPTIRSLLSEHRDFENRFREFISSKRTQTQPSPHPTMNRSLNSFNDRRSGILYSSNHSSKVNQSRMTLNEATLNEATLNEATLNEATLNEKHQNGGIVHPTQSIAHLKYDLSVGSQLAFQSGDVLL